MNQLTRLLIATILLLGISACQAPIPPTARPAANPTATLVPIEKTLPPQPTTLPTLPPTAAPTVVPMPSPTATALLPLSCAEFPGAAVCRGSASRLPVNGMLAWVDVNGGLIVANFSTGAVWNSPAPGVTRLTWKADKTHLLAVDRDGAVIFPAEGGSSTRAAEKTAQDWLPGGVMLPAGWVSNPQGGTAHLELKDGETTVRVRLSPAASAEIAWRIKSDPADQLFRLLAWLPGSDLLLGQAYFAGNAAAQQGGQLFTLDVKSGAVQPVQARAPLGAAVFPHPSQVGLLAFTESGAGGQRLAVMDAAAGKLNIITSDERVWVSRPAWTVDGISLLFSAWVLPLDAPTAAPFDLRAIYLTAPQGGPLVRLTQPPAGFLDDQPRPLADGKHFLFVRRPINGGSAELHLGSLSGTVDLPVVRGVLLPECQPQLACSQAVWGYIE